MSEELPEASSTRLKLEIAYLGTAFSGWQIQPDQISVQGELMKAFDTLCENSPRVIGAGRTDAGVHAEMQFAHVDVQDYSKRPPESWINALNSLTHPDIWVKSMEPVTDDFHARFNPHQKTYHYQCQWGSYLNPFHKHTHYHLKARHLDLDMMKAFLKSMVGTHDFKNYCSAQNETETTVRTLPQSKLIEKPEGLLIFEYQGKGFLQHMVRILTGTALHIGVGKVSLETAQEALHKDHMREELGPTLPAHGLLLKHTEYL